jgi:hypothetical protein
MSTTCCASRSGWRISASPTMIRSSSRRRKRMKRPGSYDRKLIGDRFGWAAREGRNQSLAGAMPRSFSAYRLWRIWPPFLGTLDLLVEVGKVFVNTLHRRNNSLAHMGLRHTLKSQESAHQLKRANLCSASKLRLTRRGPSDYWKS